MILASAIKLHLIDEDKYIILCGARHGDIFNQMNILGFDSNKVNEEEEGFIDHNNNFLTREEAYEHAKQCGQLCTKIIIDRETKNLFGKRLISEDLW